jgi:hypothetical protein
MSWVSSSSPPFTFHLLGWEGRRKKVVLEFAWPRLAQFIKGGGGRGGASTVSVLVPLFPLRFHGAPTRFAVCLRWFLSVLSYGCLVCVVLAFSGSLCFSALTSTPSNSSQQPCIWQAQQNCNIHHLFSDHNITTI